MVRAWIANLAAEPFSNDTLMLKAIAAGQCDVGITNSYYLGRLQHEEKDLPVQIFWADQAGKGTHVNISGGGVTKNAKNRAEAVRFLEWLASPAIQQRFAAVNFEFPANAGVDPLPEVKAWGTFKPNDGQRRPHRQDAARGRHADRPRRLALTGCSAADRERRRPPRAGPSDRRDPGRAADGRGARGRSCTARPAPIPRSGRTCTEHVLARVVVNTAVLVVGVVAIAVALGTSLAWLTAACDFPGPRLLLLGAAPADGDAGLRARLRRGRDARLRGRRADRAARPGSAPDFAVPPIRSTGGVIAVLGLASYPYVYLMARGAFLTHGARVARGRAVARLRSLGGARSASRSRSRAPGSRAARRSSPWRRSPTSARYRSSTTTRSRPRSTRPGTACSRSRRRSASRCSCSVSSRSRSPPSVSRAGARATRRPIPAPAPPARLALPGARGWFACAFAAAVFALGFVLPAHRAGALGARGRTARPRRALRRLHPAHARPRRHGGARLPRARRSRSATRRACRCGPRCRAAARHRDARLRDSGHGARRRRRDCARRDRRRLPRGRGRRGAVAAGHGARAAVRLRRALPRRGARPGAGRFCAYPARARRGGALARTRDRASSSRACTCRCSAPASARRSCSCSSTS